jgi:hypothetical protein
MNADADIYVCTLPGFIPEAELTREWAEANLGERLTDFARQLADAPVATRQLSLFDLEAAS